MPTSQYSSSFGRLQALSVNFLSPALMQDLLKVKDGSGNGKNVARNMGTAKRLKKGCFYISTSGFAGSGIKSPFGKGQ